MSPAPTRPSRGWRQRPGATAGRRATTSTTPARTATPIRTIAVLALATLTATIAPAALAAPSTSTLTITAPAEVAVEETVSVVVDLGEVTDLYSYALDLAYDADVLTFVSATAPDGGFDSTDADGGRVAVVHSRLGTSPGLAGELSVELVFTASAPGDSQLVVTALDLVGSDGEVSSPETLPETTVTVLAPAPSVSPSPSPTTSASLSASPTTSDGASGPSSTTGSAPDPTDTATSGSSGGRLSSTGADVLPLLLGALALTGLGAFLAVRRKAARR
ncbi:hypothetical protein EDD28_0992 [Salana multivorans]|uniref:Cohesin domain-containing protein n=1 Tax=Salana multivorans TaxID=120377 RepID=A0A3N2D9U8_9MICO|nr:cohesin domain-containing protein [Salana multivorans]ROR96408.1 hypothetical protein EDD28_0992 [Salana multivorans]